MPCSTNRSASAVCVGGLAVAVVTTACPLHAQHEGDIILRAAGVPARIQTGALPVGGSGPVFPVRVFSGVFEPPLNFTDEPGFDSAPGSFTPGSAIGFDILDSLRKWDGSGFEGIPPERIEIRFGILGPATTPVAPHVVPGLAASVSASGEFHRHFGFTLTAPASDGVYLLNLALWSSAPGLGRSEPFWILFQQGEVAAQLNQALAWANVNLPQSECAPDLTHSAIVGSVGYGVPNGTLNNDDFFYYLSQFALGNLAVCDLTHGAIPGSAGYGIPNAFLNNDDFFYYLTIFAAGC